MSDALDKARDALEASVKAVLGDDYFIGKMVVRERVPFQLDEPAALSAPETGDAGEPAGAKKC